MKNETGLGFKNFTPRIFGRAFSFDDFQNGETRKFKVEKSYRYFMLTAITGGDTMRLIPVDFVGETLYTDGKLNFTFKLATTETGNRVLYPVVTRNGKKLP
jgi:hypothetical protein